MKLPGDEIGISDILDYRECPQRMGFGMRRHVELPERFQLYPGEKAEAPEKRDWTNAYGSAVHDAIAIVEAERVSDDAAIDRVWVEYGPWLEPDDLVRMKHDLETYHTRTVLGYRLVGAEIEMRTPLMMVEGRQIYFRGKIDALYQSIENPEVFLSRDYKSSRWPKTAEEIHKDLQQWSYNMLIHDVYPECADLTQMYDQLRFGEEPIRKSAEQRGQVRGWLQRQVTAILSDNLLKPKLNDFCAYCPLKMDCRVTHLAGDYWKNRLSALAPEKKEGRKLIVQLKPDEHLGFEVYVDVLKQVKKSYKVMERFIAAVEEVLKQMPAERRAELGFDLSKPRGRDVFTADALRRIHEAVGDDFFHLAGISKKAVEDFYGADAKETLEIIGFAERKQNAPSLKAHAD